MICIKCKREVPDGPFCCQCGAAQQKKHRSRRANGTGTVIRRGKTYTAIATVGGYATENGKWHQVRKTKGGFRTKAEAYAYIPQLYDTTNRSTFAELLKAWQAGPYKSLSQSKQVAYDKAAKRWKSILHLDVASTTIGELQTVLDGQVKTYYPARDMQSVLSHMYKIAMAQQMVTVNLARMLTLPPLEEESPEPFTEIEIHKLWQAYADGNRFIGYPLLMIYTGMMPGELLQLKSEMVDFDSMEIIGCGLKTKKRKEVPIVFPEIIVPVLEDLIEHQGRTGRLVHYQKDYFYELYYKNLEDAGVRQLPPYSCRHTTATALALGNIAPSAIQEVMRHSKLATTQRYIHMSSSEAHEAVATLGKGKEA